MRGITHRCIFAAIIGSAALLHFTSCKTAVKELSKDISPVKSVALFDSFNYTGNDDFYNENSLPAKSSFYNPVLPGWYSDPSVCNDGENYFLVTSTFSYYPGVPLFHSKDLVNWKQIGHVLDRPSQLINMEGQNVSGGIFAPAIEYNPHNKTYYMITTNVGVGNFFVKTTNPFGKWSDPIMLPEVGGIDPSFFFDEDGKAYIVNNDDAPDNKPEYSGHRTIRVREFDVKSDRVVGNEKILVNKGARPQDNPIWIEGPHMYKINGKYFLMSAEGGTGSWHSEVIFRGNSPMGTFTPWDKNPILTQRILNPERPNPITCAGHADLIKTNDGDWWAFFLACRPINNTFENLGRETFMMPVKWSEDGYPYMTQGDDVVPSIIRRKDIQYKEDGWNGNFVVTDNFDSDTLRMDWLTLRTPATNHYSLTDVPGMLSLKCSDIKVSDKKTPAFIGRRLQHHKFECSVKMIFQPDNENEKAGMLLFKDETHYYFMSVGRKDGKKVISLLQSSEQGDKNIASTALEHDTNNIYMKVVSAGLTYDFYHSSDNKTWKALAKNVNASYLSTATAGGFTGTTIGMYAIK